MGHDAGAELLKTVAARLESITRAGDVVARLGGDEFVVICRGLLNEESVVAVAQQILRRFTDPVTLKGREHRVTTSVGVAVADGSEIRDPEALVRDADAAMYVAKRNRSGFAVFDDAHRSYLTNRLDIERELRRALDDDQLLVFYQPIVDVGADRLYGFEALVRWNHPQRGLLPPSEFLSVAEEARLMSEVGEVVLREACAQAAVWNHLCPEARTIRIGVNVSEQQLADPELPELISEILTWSGLGADQLVLEITEDVIVEHLAGLTVLRELRGLGVGLAIDDFGTGQSSLSYVKQFDMVSTLKIDQSFVRDMHVGAADLAIIDAVVAMSSALDLRVVAEGVERADQIEVLADLGIRLMQGFYFNAPLAPEDLDDPRNWFETGPLSNPDGLKPLAISRSFASGQLPTPRPGPR
jgi:predicted signal transduction protein with EAL and GGDEF domain